MQAEEANNLTYVFEQLSVLEYDDSSWTELDEYLVYLQFLGDRQLVIEAKVVLDKHKSGNPRCVKNHPKEECLVTNIIKATETIVGLYETQHFLHFKNKMILQYYISLDQTREILS